VFRRFYAQQTGDPDAQCIAQLIFKCYPKTKTVARFDQAQVSTDGGVRLLKALDDCPSSRTAWRRACPIVEISTRSGTPPATCCASTSLAWRVGMRMATPRPGWLTIPCASWQWGGTQ
jgi:hypothetical protein